MKKIIASAIILIAAGSQSFAQQADAATTATANIVAPITITAGDPFSFGFVGATAAGGTVVLSAAGLRTGFGVTPASGGTTTAASFDVTGEAASTYSISFPVAPVALSKIGGADMTVDTWTTSILATPLIGTLDGTGAQAFTAGATLHVGANQDPGTYTSLDFNVSVDYN